MPIVKLGVSRQVVIPKKIHDKLQLHPGDYLEVEVKDNQLILTPQAFIEKRLAEGLEDIQKGRVSPAFTSAEAMIRHLHQQVKKRKKTL